MVGKLLKVSKGARFMFGENKLRKLYWRGPWLKTEDNKEIHINPEKINVKKSATSEYSKQM